MRYVTIKENLVNQLGNCTVDASTGCWNWCGQKNSKGYGRLTAPLEWRSSGSVGAALLAHRFSYFMTYGSFNEDKFVCHKCDNPLCINPEHLFLGTQKDNLQDASRKGRLVGKNKRSDGPQGKKFEVLRLHATGKGPAEIAKILNFRRKTVGAALQRWRLNTSKELLK